MLLPCVQICTLGTSSKGLVKSRVCHIQEIVTDASLVKLRLETYVYVLYICRATQMQRHGEVLSALYLQHCST